MKNDYIAVIQAGGKGTRLFELTKDLIPKPMLPLNGKPMIQWQIESVKKYGITEVALIIGHLGEKVKEYFGDGSDFGVKIHYIVEDENTPLGSAGSLYYLKDILGDRSFLLIFGDVMFDIAWDRMIAFHEEKGGELTLLAHPNAHPYDSDLLVLDENKCVVGLDSKNNKRDYWYDNVVNAGIYIANASLLEHITKPVKTDLEADLMRPLLGQNKVYGYVTPEFVKDAGTVDRFLSVQKAQSEGVWAAKNLENKQKCIFLDRDGTINVYKGLIADEDLLELMEGAAKAIAKINASGYLAILITNQPIVARGMCEIEDVNRIHRKLQVLLGNEGAFLDDIVFCPHHPDKGYPEENPLYKIKCNCRKPATGMIDAMVEKYNIDVENSYMIGDMTMDIKLAENAHLHSVLLECGASGSDGAYEITPEIVAKDLLDAVDKILDK